MYISEAYQLPKERTSAFLSESKPVVVIDGVVVIASVQSGLAVSTIFGGFFSCLGGAFYFSIYDVTYTLLCRPWRLINSYILYTYLYTLIKFSVNISCHATLKNAELACFDKNTGYCSKLVYV